VYNAGPQLRRHTIALAVEQQQRVIVGSEPPLSSC
jgi:hypothetical protein